MTDACAIARRYHWGVADILVRAVPESDAVRIAANAARAGLSQSEYLRRLIHEEAQRKTVPLASLAGTATGLFPTGILAELDEEWT